MTLQLDYIRLSFLLSFYIIFAIKLTPLLEFIFFSKFRMALDSFSIAPYICILRDMILRKKETDESPIVPIVHKTILKKRKNR